MQNICIIFGAGKYGIDLYNKMMSTDEKCKSNILFADTFRCGEKAINDTIILDANGVKEICKNYNAKVYIATRYYEEIFLTCIRKKIKVDGIYCYEKREILSYEMTKGLENKNQEKIIKNFYNTDFKKNVLISYILEPFDCKFNGIMPHANFQHSIAMSEVFREMKYNVDIIHYNTRIEIDCEKYDILIGFGSEFEKFVLSGKNKKTKTVVLLTGASPYFNNLAELNRLSNFEQRHDENVFELQRVEVGVGKGDLLDLKCLKQIDYAICFGNYWTINTYRNMFRREVFGITPTGMNKFGYIRKRIENTRNNYLWFGGSSEIHKGLDLCIEYFSLNRNLNLYIAGNLSYAFINYYKDELGLNNIHYVGFINIADENYYKLCETCCFTILPSCSEANSTAVLTNMFSGLIPVVTKEAGIDIEGNGFLIKEGTVEGIKSVIEEIQNVSDENLKEMSIKAYNIAISNHTTEKFKSTFRHIIKIIEND